MSEANGPERTDAKGYAVNTLLELWNGLDGRRRGLLIGGISALAVVLVILTRIASQPSYALLYSGLDPAAAGEVVEAISARGVAYRVEGESDPCRRVAARRTSDGIGRRGLTCKRTPRLRIARFAVGVRNDIANVRRRLLAREGRGVGAHDPVVARDSSGPRSSRQPLRRSVSADARSHGFGCDSPRWGGLAPGHAQALRFLVASSVPGLSPDNVTIMDADSGQVLGAQNQMNPAADAAGRADQLRLNVERLLAARVGPGNAVVQVAVELETARETIRERVIDPESRVIIATETEDSENATRDGAAAGVTVASNLPTGDGSSGEGSSAETTESRERVTFDMSELQRETEREPGALRRITVAVLLNGVDVVGANGVVETVPRPDEEVEALTRLVQSAIGYDEARGDQVTIQSMAFDAAAITDLAEAGFADRFNVDLGRIVQMAILALVALGVALGIVRPMLLRSTSSADEANSGVLPSATAVAGLPAPSNDSSAGGFNPNSLPMMTAPESPDIGDLSSGPGGMAGDNNLPTLSMIGSAFDDALPMMMSGGMRPDLQQNLEDMDPVDRLRFLIQEREEETVQILRSWMNEDDGVPQ